MPRSERSMAKHWYFFTVFECPVCGRTHTYKERRYTRKPKSWAKRHKFIPSYDWCL